MIFSYPGMTAISDKYFNARSISTSHMSQYTQSHMVSKNLPSFFIMSSRASSFPILFVILVPGVMKEFSLLKFSDRRLAARTGAELSTADVRIVERTSGNAHDCKLCSATAIGRPTLSPHRNFLQKMRTTSYLRYCYLFHTRRN